MNTVLHEVFYWVFNMSVAAALTGLAVAAVRWYPKLPRRMAVVLWLIPGFRMLIPLSPDSPLSLLSWLPHRSVPVGPDVSMLHSSMAALTSFPITFQTDVLAQVFQVAAVVWLIVFLALVLAMGSVYLSTLREMRDVRLLRDNIYLSDKLLSPAVYGILRPKIILPTSWAEKDLTYILLHERAHIRRGDGLWRLIGFFLAAAYWFDPLSWLFLKLFLADMEMACDESVLARVGEDQAKAYALALLESKQSASVFVSAFGGAKIRTRIDRILSFKKLTWLSVVGAVALLVPIFYVLLTNPG